MRGCVDAVAGRPVGPVPAGLPRGLQHQYDGAAHAARRADPHGPGAQDEWGRPASAQQAVTGSDAAATAALVDAVMTGPWTRDALVRRLTRAQGLWLPTAEIVALVRRLERLGRPDRTKVAALLGEPTAPPRYPTRIRTRTDLRRLLDLDEGELDWFADRQHRNDRTTSARLRHYHYRVVGRGRLLEIPKPRLMEIQRRLARHVISALPLSVHAHGGVAGRGVRTATAPHAGHDVLVRFDLETFFAAVADVRVRGVLRHLDADADVAALVTGMCTARVPADVLARVQADPAPEPGHRWRSGRRLSVPHLPQGAPTSPSLANAVAGGLDRRLAALADSYAGQYTRYVDDLLISGNDLAVGYLLDAVRAIVRDEGFRLNEAKTLVRRRARRQSALSVVVNDGPTIRRTQLDRLRAILHNCAVHGPLTQTRGAELDTFRRRLLGQVSWVNSIDPVRGAQLRAAFDRIVWPEGDPATDSRWG